MNPHNCALSACPQLQNVSAAASSLPTLWLAWPCNANCTAAPVMPLQLHLPFCPVTCRGRCCLAACQGVAAAGPNTRFMPAPCRLCMHPATATHMNTRPAVIKSVPRMSTRPCTETHGNRCESRLPQGRFFRLQQLLMQMLLHWLRVTLLKVDECGTKFVGCCKLTTRPKGGINNSSTAASSPNAQASPRLPKDS